VATRLVRETLEEFPGQTKAKSAGEILVFFREGDFLLRELLQPAPDQMWPAAEIHHTACEAFIHRHVSLSRQRRCGFVPGSHQAGRISGMEAVAIAANASFVS